MTTLSSIEPAGPGQNRFYIQEPPLPHNVEWPPFVMDYPRQIDFPLHVVGLDSAVPQDPRFLKVLADYIILKKQGIEAEEELIKEYQLVLSPQAAQFSYHPGFAHHRWIPSVDARTVQARRRERIRTLEDAHLHRRLKRAHLEISILTSQVAASKSRLSAARIPRGPDVENSRYAKHTVPFPRGGHVAEGSSLMI